ncbi:MAG: hypothetical protein IT463_11775, partial [Planctomycetes bacterium]|nr:hypothetical protein [Planctomycetota bacterium]
MVQDDGHEIGVHRVAHGVAVVLGRQLVQVEEAGALKVLYGAGRGSQPYGTPAADLPPTNGTACSAPDRRKLAGAGMKVLVEVSQGIGNCVQGTPTCHALWLSGHEVDLFVHRRDCGAEPVADLWHDWPVLGRVLTRRDQLHVRSYDFAVSCYGKHLLQQLFPPGLCVSVVRTAALYQSETEANMQVARWLGYSGDTPPCHVGRSARRFDLGPRAITVHAGCAHFAQEKRWPHWDEVCRRLKADGWRVVVVGTPSDRSSENWEQAYDSFFDLGLRDLNALLQEATAHFG